PPVPPARGVAGPDRRPPGRGPAATDAPPTGAAGAGRRDPPPRGDVVPVRRRRRGPVLRPHRPGDRAAVLHRPPRARRPSPRPAAGRLAGAGGRGLLPGDGAPAGGRGPAPPPAVRRPAPA